MSQQRHTTVIQSDSEPTIVIDDANGGWFRLWNSIVLSGKWASLSSAAKAVLVVLAQHANREWIAFPGRARIQKYAGVGRTQARSAVRELEAKGLIVLRGAGSGLVTTTYQILQPDTGPEIRPGSEIRPSRKSGGRGAGNPTPNKTIESDSSSTANPAPTTTPPAEKRAAAGLDPVQEIEQVLAVHRIGRARRGNLAHQAVAAGVSSTRITDVLDATDGGPGLKIAKVEDLIDAAHAAKGQATAKAKVEADLGEQERQRREAEEAEIVTGDDRKTLIRQTLDRLR